MGREYSIYETVAAAVTVVVVYVFMLYFVTPLITAAADIYGFLAISARYDYSKSLPTLALRVLFLSFISAWCALKVAGWMFSRAYVRAVAVIFGSVLLACVVLPAALLGKSMVGESPSDSDHAMAVAPPPPRPQASTPPTSEYPELERAMRTSLAEYEARRVEEAANAERLTAALDGAPRLTPVDYNPFQGDVDVYAIASGATKAPSKTQEPPPSLTEILLVFSGLALLVAAPLWLCLGLWREQEWL